MNAVCVDYNQMFEQLEGINGTVKWNVAAPLPVTFSHSKLWKDIRWNLAVVVILAHLHSWNNDKCALSFKNIKWNAPKYFFCTPTNVLVSHWVISANADLPHTWTTLENNRTVVHVWKWLLTPSAKPCNAMQHKY